MNETAYIEGKRILRQLVQLTYFCNFGAKKKEQ